MGPDVVLLEVVDDDLLGDCDLSPEFPEVPLLVQLQDLLEVIANLIGFESFNVEDVVIGVTVNPNNDNSCVVSFSSKREGEVNSSKDVESTVFEEPLSLTSVEELWVIILETLSGNCCIFCIVRIIVILGSKLNTV